MLRRLWLAAALIAAAAAPAGAQQLIPPQPTQAYTLTVVTSTTLAVNTTSARVALGTPAVSIWVTNSGLVAACLALGSTSVVATCPGVSLAPGQTKVLGTGSAVDLAAITLSGSTSLVIKTGYLAP